MINSIEGFRGIKETRVYRAGTINDFINSSGKYPCDNMLEYNIDRYTQMLPSANMKCSAARPSWPQALPSLADLRLL